jgi:hypothetical protein
MCYPFIWKNLGNCLMASKLKLLWSLVLMPIILFTSEINLLIFIYYLNALWRCPRLFAEIPWTIDHLILPHKILKKIKKLRPAAMQLKGEHYHHLLKSTNYFFYFFIYYLLLLLTQFSLFIAWLTFHLVSGFWTLKYFHKY